MPDFPNFFPIFRETIFPEEKEKAAHSTRNKPSGVISPDPWYATMPIPQKDTIAPTINSASFAFLTNHSVVYQFSENCYNGLSSADITVQNLTTAQTIPASVRLVTSLTACQSSLSVPLDSR